jgi:hypothetical protein
MMTMLFLKLFLKLLLVAAVSSYKRPLERCDPAKILTISFTTDEYPTDTTWRLQKKGSTWQTIISMPTLYASGYRTPIYDIPFATYEDSICLEGLPFAQCYEFTISDEFDDGICYDIENSPQECGSYTLTLGDGTILASGGESFDGEKEIVEFCINGDGNDDFDDDDDDDDDDNDSNRRALAAKDEECPSVRNIAFRTRVKNCDWVRRKMNGQKDSVEYPYFCQDQLEDSPKKFTVNGKEKTCAKVFKKELAPNKLKNMCKKPIENHSCGEEGVRPRVWDYCRNSCSALDD